MGFLLKGSSGSGDFAPLPAGPHVARCVAFVDLGTQKQEFQGQTSTRRKVRVTWEVPSERMNDGRAMTISKTYTASLDPKATLRADLEGWRNKAFTEAEIHGWEAEQLLGRACQINVVHNVSPGTGKTYAAVRTVMPLGKGQTCEPQESASVFFNLDEFDPGVFASLSKYTQETIAKSPEYIEAIGKGTHVPAGGIDDDDVPF